YRKSTCIGYAEGQWQSEVCQSTDDQWQVQVESDALVSTLSCQPVHADDPVINGICVRIDDQLPECNRWFWHLAEWTWH
ncbi:MAG: hypothetical protein KTR32_09670, partial [Granulosicoccus sp.]|nr:hypothetical protein [Granulosicoccus sp.]